MADALLELQRHRRRARRSHCLPFRPPLRPLRHRHAPHLSDGQSARWTEWGERPKLLHEFRSNSKGFQSPNKGFYDLGDIAALIDPAVATWETVDCPEVDWDLAYKFRKTKGQILRCSAIDRDKTFALFEEKLKNMRQRP